VLRAAFERLQDQHVERSLQQLDAVVVLRRRLFYGVDNLQPWQ
jgi:hypothetical protein